MGKTYKITEEQHNQLMQEGVAIQGETDASGKADIAKTSQEITNSGIDPKKVDVTFSGDQVGAGTPTSEHRVVTKRQLAENRKRYLKENSEVISFSEFLRSIN